MRRVYTFGETTCDILFKDEKPVDAKVGGSALNTSVSLARLGADVRFVTHMGHDRLGDMSLRFLQRNGVNVSHVVRYEGNSRVALAFLDQDNNASYTFFKDERAESAVPVYPHIEPGDVVLFGSSYAVKPQGRDEFTAFVRRARAQGAFVVYDPNFRKSHKDLDAMVLSFFMENISLAHIVKGSDEDFRNIFDADGPSDAWNAIKTQAPVLVYTANKHGVHLYTPTVETSFDVPAIEPVSTVGAGDTFNAGLVYGMLKHNILPDNLSGISREIWVDVIAHCVRFAQAVCMSLENYVPEHLASAFRLSVSSQ